MSFTTHLKQNNISFSWMNVLLLQISIKISPKKASSRYQVSVVTTIRTFFLALHFQISSNWNLKFNIAQWIMMMMTNKKKLKNHRIRLIDTIENPTGWAINCCLFFHSIIPKRLLNSCNLYRVINITFKNFSFLLFSF